MILYLTLIDTRLKVRSLWNIKTGISEDGCGNDGGEGCDEDSGDVSYEDNC